MKNISWTTLLALIVAGTACAPRADSQQPAEAEESHVQKRLAIYTEVDLAPDLSGLSDSQREVVAILVEAASATTAIFWQQAYGDKESLLATIDDSATQRFLEINFGPWDRLDANAPFLDGVGAKPLGANFYPADITREELEAAGNDELKSLYTLVRRAGDGTLTAVPYHEAFAEHIEFMAERLRAAAEVTETPSLEHYLNLRADALLSDDYQASDFAWMDMKDNTIEVIIGPIETYEDQFLGAKASYEALVLIKDQEWSARLARYATLLPSLQKTLPVADEYKAEVPGTEAELNAYDLVFAAGAGNEGAKSIAVNLPNDEQVQLAKGTRRLQIKNAMRAKFDAILGPIAAQLIVPEQRAHVTFEAFFANTMFHEVAHGLGIKNTLNDRGTVRHALQDHASWVEEGKADILGLHMLTELHDADELGDADLMDNYVTFVASIFRSVRFGTTSAHGRANLVRFSYFMEQGVIQRDATGLYSIDFEAMQSAMRGLAERLLTMQGDGDRDGVQMFWDQWGVVGPDLQEALDRLSAREIPVDIVYRQGLDVLGF